MDALLPQLLLLFDLVGLGLSLWLSLHLLIHAWGWQRSRARPAALALFALALLFALGVYDSVWPLAGASTRGSIARLALLPLPVAWVLLARRLTLGAAQASDRVLKWLVVLLTLGGLGISLLFGPLRPTWLVYSWLLFPLYGLALLLACGLAISLANKARTMASTRWERRALFWLKLSSALLLLGGMIVAAHTTFGLTHPLFRPVTGWILPLELRLMGAGVLLLAGFALGQLVLAQARAEGAPHLVSFAHSALVTLVMTLFYVGVGGLVVWRWGLPPLLLGIFLALALLTDLLDNATRAPLERWLYRPETGALRRDLRRVAERMETPDPVPPAVRPLLARLARQLSTPQLGIALVTPNSQPPEYRIVAALRPSWEGQTVDVQNPLVWEERVLGGWNLPLKDRDGKAIGVIASDHSAPLSPVQQQLMADTANKIVQLLEEWKVLTERRASLQKALEAYRDAATTMDSKLATLGAPAPLRSDLFRLVLHALRNHNDSAALERSPLTQLSLVARLAGSAKGSAGGRAELLRELFFHLVEQLRPYEGDPLTRPTPEWRAYLILKKVYLEGEPEQEWMIRLRLDPRSFQRERRSAVEKVARVLAELEAGAARLAAPQKALPPSGGAAPQGGSPYSPGRTEPPRAAPPALQPPAASASPAPPPGGAKPAPTDKAGALGGLSKRFLPGALATSARAVAKGMPAAPPPPSGGAPATDKKPDPAPPQRLREAHRLPRPKR